MFLSLNNVLVKYIIALIISTGGGSLLIFLIKKNFTDASIKYTFDPLGILERLIITVFVPMGSFFLLAIPVVVAIKVGYYLFGLSAWSSMFAREEPAITYQKVKFKGSLAVELIGSPLFAILIGVILRELL